MICVAVGEQEVKAVRGRPAQVLAPEGAEVRGAERVIDAIHKRIRADPRISACLIWGPATTRRGAAPPLRVVGPE